MYGNHIQRIILITLCPLLGENLLDIRRTSNQTSWVFLQFFIFTNIEKFYMVGKYCGMSFLSILIRTCHFWAKKNFTRVNVFENKLYDHFCISPFILELVTQKKLRNYFTLNIYQNIFMLHYFTLNIYQNIFMLHFKSQSLW